MSQRTELKTSDNVDIVADYYPADSDRGIVLAHMMPATKESWRDLALKLQAAAFHALAIDLRGHGESGGGDYRKFSDAEHQASIHDLEAAAEFLKQKGVTGLAAGGASIGANLSLGYLAEHPEIAAVILLSPGIDYRGIKIEPLASKIMDKNKILFVGAEDDAATMERSCGEISRALGNPPKFCFETGGHGTNLFQSHPDLMGEIVEFLTRRLKK